VTGAIVQLGPLGGSHDAGPLLGPYTIAYLAGVGALAAAAFARTDLCQGVRAIVSAGCIPGVTPTPRG
jgi:hypothetical protein